MTIDQLIAQVRAAITGKLEARTAQSTIIDNVRSACLAAKSDPTDDQASSVRAAQTAQTSIDAEITQLRATLAEYETEKSRDEAAAALSREFTPGAGLPAYDQVARVGQEPRTYTAHADSNGSASFFRDAYLSEFKRNSGARARIERHAAEVLHHNEITERATATGSFAGLIVPQYLTDLAAVQVRAGRPFANTLTSLQIPEQGTQFQIPRGTTGATAAVQASENTSVSATDEVWANVTVNVATIAGQQDVSRQSLERGTPGIDALIYLDLAGAYGVAVDQQVLSGSGSAGQVLGVLNTAGVNQATAFPAAATPTTFYSKVAGQVNAVETTRFMAPTAIVMHPRRWNWLVAQVDSQGRPLVVPNQNGAFNALGITDTPQDQPKSTPVGWLQGLPVVSDASIPAAVGTGPEDQVIVYRKEDLILWEDGDGMPRELRFDQTLGNQITTKLVCYNYIAFTAARYATAIGIVGGNAGTIGFGLIAPTF